MDGSKLRPMTLARFRRRATTLGIEPQADLCAFCLERPATTRDHFIPRARLRLWRWLGQDQTHNVVPACRECNEKKGNLPLWDWIKKLYWRGNAKRKMPFKFKIGDTDTWQRYLRDSGDGEKSQKPED